MSILRWAALAVLLAAPVRALAQDRPSDYAGPARLLRADDNLCTEALGLPCRGERKVPLEDILPKTGMIVKFSRLAGMFMGRVDAARSGDWHLRFTLDIDSPPSSTNNHIDLGNRAG